MAGIGVTHSLAVPCDNRTHVARGQNGLYVCQIIGRDKSRTFVKLEIIGRVFAVFQSGGMVRK